MPSRLAPSKLPKCCYFIVVSTRLAPSKLPKCRYFLSSCLAPSKLRKCCHLSFFPSDLRPRGHQSVATFVFLSRLRPRSYQRVSYFRVPFLSCALEVTKVFLFSFSLPDLRPQGHQSFPSFVPSSRLTPSKLPKCHCFMVVSTGLAPSKSRSFRVHPVFEDTKMPLFIVLSSLPAPSKLPKCHDLRVPLLSCALEVTKVSLFLVFPTRPAISRLPKCLFFRAPPSPLAPLKLPKCPCFEVFPT